ncbi:MAG TPA: biotin--[acetyl-CoA-carboxylase] ligase [Nocardioidaceae bacterium]|nr:biotin--[acetyl-CoA-carboxylase] ligase [Nocardioidaceae bacterium]
MSPEPLDRAAIERALVQDDSLWRELDLREQTESTNADVAAAARDGAAEGLVVTTEHQVAGRGRLGRSWESPPRSGLAVSVLLRPESVPASRWPWLPLLVGLAVRESVVTVAGVEAVLKWPNDVLVGGRKLAGILVERIDSDAGPAAVVGVGINVSLAADQLPTPEATSLRLTGATSTDRTVLLVDLLRRLETRYRVWLTTAGDPEPLRTAYVSACATVGQRVRVAMPDGTTLVGRAVGIDAAGRLEIDTDGVRRAVGAGDVVHLRSGS